MKVEVTYSDDPGRMLEKAGEFLASEPVLHNIILTILHYRTVHPEPGRYWAAVRGRKVCGVALQSPLHLAATVTPMAMEAVAAVVDRIADQSVVLPGVNGEVTTAARFAGQWAERTKAAAIPYMGLRLYEMRDLLLGPPASGGLRQATPDDRETVVDWVRRFQTEAGEAGDPATLVDQWLGAGYVWIWDDGGPVSMLVTRKAVAGVARITGVYTPRDRRKRGYAGAAVSEISRMILDRGRRPILYTDLGNPTSNSLYQRLGYRVVAEAIRYRFE